MGNKQYDDSKTVFFTKKVKDGKEYYFTRADGETFDKLASIKAGDWIYLRTGVSKNGKAYASLRAVPNDDKYTKSDTEETL